MSRHQRIMSSNKMLSSFPSPPPENEIGLIFGKCVNSIGGCWFVSRLYMAENHGKEGTEG